MKESDVLAQSKAAYGQWAPQWREHARYNSKHEMRDLLDFQNIGIGKACLLIANGASFEMNIETIKKYQQNVDIMVVDKSLKHCLDHGIIPDYCLVCDANVSRETYLQPVEDKLQDTVLISNVCANPEWPEKGNWKSVYFFTNKDVLGSEKEFGSLSGCGNVIPAATNVSNAALVALTQCDDQGKNNFFGYDKYLLIGFDYCWNDGAYYSFDEDGSGKIQYMKTTYVLNLKRELVFTSPNLLFSAKWIEKYINVYQVPAIQCAKESILSGWKTGDLADQMQYEYRRKDANEVHSLLEYRRKLSADIDAINEKIRDIGRDHYKSIIRTT